MISSGLNYHSERAVLARFSVKLAGSFVGVLLVFAGLGLWLLAAVLYVQSLSFLAFLVAAPGGPLLMIWLWNRLHLRRLQINQTSEAGSIDQYLASDVLGKLGTKEVSPREILKLISNSAGRRFWLNRFGLTDELLGPMLSENPEHSTFVWSEALNTWQKYRMPQDNRGINASVLTFALLKTSTNYQAVLNSVQLSDEDLLAGLAWYEHQEATFEKLASRQRFGGVGRDWAAGYTPLLNQYGRNVSSEIQYGGLLYRDVSAHQATLKQIYNVFATNGRSNIALVGELGVGKTTTVYAFAEQLLTSEEVPANIRYHQIFMVDSATLVTNTKDLRQAETLFARIVNEAYRAKNILLFFDDSMQIFGANPEVNLTTSLLPVIKSGAVRMIFSFTPNEWQKVLATNTALSSELNYQVVNETDEHETLRIVEDQILITEHQFKCVFTMQAIKEAYRLSSRYVRYQGQPGKTLKVLEDAARFATGSLITKEVVQKSVEASTGVKLAAANQDEKNTLLNLEDKLHERMINQSQAVVAVASALRRSRSGVGNPNRPIGTFLFLGPTGVGKTELTKALAHVYFGGEERMVRLDMNEFVTNDHVHQLIAARAEVGTTFLEEIRQQPFSVVLFDELEKAHPDIINIFLQMLDEGVMRDDENQEVSFRDAIIIATSNAGAEDIRARIDAGQDLSQFKDEFVNKLIESGQFKPEFLNRFDEIVLFRPLKPEELMQVTRLIIASVNKNLEAQKVSVEITDAGLQWLVTQGYDARLGARPLRRAVQRSVEDIVSKKLLEGSLKPGDTLRLDLPELQGNQQQNQQN